VVGAVSFLTGASVLLALGSLDDDPESRLFELNVILSTATVYLGLGTVLTVTAASALGKTASSPMRVDRAWWLALAVPFPFLVAAGQFLAGEPERAPWVFPFVNVAMVSIPSMVIALLVFTRYARANPWSWPVSRREWASGFIYGAVGATSIAGVINTLYLIGMSVLLISTVGDGLDVNEFDSGVRSLPKGWGIFLDVSTLSIVAPLNEEFWKGMLVAFFFFRRGGVARCFLWGVLAGTGFNLLETYSNSLSAVDPDAIADSTIGSEWWFFALARTGTAAMHGLATGFAAIGFYAIFRRKWRYLPALLAGPLFHAAWNFFVYLIWGDAFLSEQGWDTRLLDILGAAGLIGEFLLSCYLLWRISGGLRDESPAPFYALLWMRPATPVRGVAGERVPGASDRLPAPVPYPLTSTAGSAPPGTLTSSASRSTLNRMGVSP
jgi:hypothetical protein